jgi:hypothetical protein
MNRTLAPLTLVAILAGSAATARAVAVDGVLDPEYGAPRAVQTTRTSAGDQPADFMYGSELDAAYGFVAGDTLYLLVTGNFNRFLSEPLTFPNMLQLFFDAKPGGQNPLVASNPAPGFFVDLGEMTGLAFDPEFVPDYWLAGDRESYDGFFAFYAELPAGGGGAGAFLGAGPIGGPGMLGGTGASNPYGILATVDISNTAGVTAGCDGASGAGVTTGAEWAIPLAALGNPTGTLRICALLAGAWSTNARVFNQVLGPVPPGTCTLGPADTVDFSTLAGAQYFTIDVTTPAKRPTWGRLKAAYR